MKKSLIQTRTILPLIFLALSFPAFAAPPAPPQNATALLLSDIHFDPFHDPGKLNQLVSAPAENWDVILASEPAFHQAQNFDKLQKACGARGIDTPYSLLESSLKAVVSNAANVRFVTVSGDLLAHGFSCRYNTLLPNSTPDEYAEFVQKTILFLMSELTDTLPGIPVYMAMGNNDSACGDYRMDANDKFLSATAEIINIGLPKSKDTHVLLRDFTTAGAYAVTLPLPIRNTRLLILDDLFLSRKYTNCAGQPDPAAITAQLTWLDNELALARKHKQHVWVMGHIPPGVDIYSTYSKLKDPCTGAPAAMFLSSERLTDLLFEYSDVVKLGIFAHTHMDEMRLFHPEGLIDNSKSVPIKLVSSISPVDGNSPSFTIATINNETANLLDYQVFTASNQTGIGATWSKEYDYADTYHQPDFSAVSLQHILNGFQSDPTASTPASASYIANYFPGDKSSLIKPLWPQYTCSLSHNTEKGFLHCACPASKP